VISEVDVTLSPCIFFMGFRIAMYLSAENAAKVKTETPMLISFTNSENLQINSPKGQESIVYKVDVKGMQNRMTQRSPAAMEKMNLSQRKYDLNDTDLSFIVFFSTNIA